MSTWNDNRLDELSTRTDEGFKEVKHQFEKIDERFEKVDQEFKTVRQEFTNVRQEMKEGFAQVPTRDEMNQRFNELNRWLAALLTLGVGAIVGNGVFG